MAAVKGVVVDALFGAKSKPPETASIDRVLLLPGASPPKPRGDFHGRMGGFNVVMYKEWRMRIGGSELGFRKKK